MSMSAWSIAMLLAYLAGSIPFGLLIGRARGVDIRQHGSKNIGATNCGRVLGRQWGMLCFVLDVFKGAGPVVAAGAWFGWLSAENLTTTEAGLWTGIAAAAVVGHVLPVWLKFRGGKGVATGLGAVLGIWPYMTLPGLAAFATWILFTATFRYVGVSSVISAILLPIYLMAGASMAGWAWTTIWPFVTVAGLMAVLILIRHRGNLARTWAGTEARVGRR
ncbi:glycerol-3-phosphate 1-O-acyltransferase PlsY [Planctomycetales bacterium ZRK34]|nr:glycerol-3-phosphate 1-O-acyltransferase PlsY [Planctomycetales bacterium ZRK34]